jgi:hypothetical protein
VLFEGFPSVSTWLGNCNLNVGIKCQLSAVSHSGTRLARAAQTAGLGSAAPADR